MNRKIVLPFLLAVLFASLGTCTHPVRADSNDFISFPSGITLFSPLNSTYNSQYLTLNLALYSAGSMGYIDSRISLNYSIDGKLNGQVPLTVSNPGVHVITNGVGLVSLPELSEGSHSLTLYLEGFNQKYSEPRFLSYADIVHFSIDLTAPNVSILSPVNKTYTAANITTASILLDFTADEDVSKVTYSLDGQNAMVIAGNTTLTGLPFGSHNVTMYVQDLAGNGASETVSFTIVGKQESKLESEPELFLTVPVAAVSVVAVALVSAGLLVYNKKRRGNVG